MKALLLVLLGAAIGAVIAIAVVVRRMRKGWP